MPAARRASSLLWMSGFAIAVGVAGVWWGPSLAGSARLAFRNGTLARTERKLEALRTFALFRAPGDRAALREIERHGATRPVAPGPRTCENKARRARTKRASARPNARKLTTFKPTA